VFHATVNRKYQQQENIVARCCVFVQFFFVSFLASQPASSRVAETFLGKTSSRASSSTWIPSREASSVMVKGGAILVYSPLGPTGTNINKPLWKQAEENGVRKWGQGLICDLMAFTCLSKLGSSAIFFLVIATLLLTGAMHFVCAAANDNGCPSERMQKYRYQTAQTFDRWCLKNRYRSSSVTKISCWLLPRERK
jgi:hypothetical protein